MNKKRKRKHNFLVSLSVDNDSFINDFSKTAKRNIKEAYSILNDEELTFPEFYILVPQIKEYSLISGLNKKNTSALKLIAKITNDEELIDIIGELVYDNNLKTALYWIFETGLVDDGIYDSYDKIIDTTIALLIDYYGQDVIIPEVVDLMFSRNRSDLYIHDLMFILFRVEDLNLLTLLAKYLNSNDKKDRKLAYELLYLDKDTDEDIDNNNIVDRYNEFLNWLRENFNYLYFTKETLQLTRYPKWYKIDLGAKYLCVSIDPHTRLPLKPFNMNQYTKNEDFKVLPLDDKFKLSDYSQKLYKSNLNEWKNWMKYSINRQLLMLKNIDGGAL